MLLGVLLLIYPHADCRRFPGLRRAVFLPCFTIFVRIVHSATKQHVCIVHVRIFFSPKNAFAHRYDASTPGGAGEGRSGCGVSPSPPAARKNGYKHRPFWWRTCPLTGEKTQKTGTRKTWQKVAKNGVIQIYNYKNPYIVFVTVERTKLVMYVGG